MKTSYREQDIAFGQAILTLRTRMGLTQVSLANHLHVSRRAVGEWEMGNSYPKSDHLKALIVLAVQQQAFASEHEAEEIRGLWQAAHQKVLLDEHWLSTLLYQRSPPLLHIETSHLAEQTRVRKAVGTASYPSPQTVAAEIVPCTSPPVINHLSRRPLLDWDDAQTITNFYGREEELALLSQWVLQECCRVVSVLGMGGIGKSVLSVNLMYRLAEHFEVVIFRSLRNAPACEILLDDCLQVLSLQAQEGRTSPPVTLEQRISLLLEYLHKTRALIVLDNMESLLQEGDIRGHLHPDFEGYERLLYQVAQTAHQSCLLFTSREKLVKLRPLEGKYSPVHSLRLTGLDVAACKSLLKEKELVGTESEQARLIEIYGGNPLALRIVAETIIDLFRGEIGPFLVGDVLVFGSITNLLREQFVRLSALEQTVLYWLAITREPITIKELLALQVSPLSYAQVLEAVDSNYRRSLIDRGKRPGSFTLQSVGLEYVTSVLIAEASNEIQQGRLNRLIQYSLEQATAHEYVRQTQERLLLSPLLADLQNVYRKRSELEQHLLSLLDQLRKENDATQGYGPANVIALLRLQRGHLNALDLSDLSIRGAYLQNTQMRDTLLIRARISETVFTEALSVIWAMAVSLDGKLWAAGGLQGKVSIWDEASHTPRLIWQPHTDVVKALAFSPDGQTLASSSLDGTIKLWNIGAILCGRSREVCPPAILLWTGWAQAPLSLAFSPDGSLLASGGLDATVRLWDVQSGTNLQTLIHPSHVFEVTWSPDGHLLASCCFDGAIRLWRRQKTGPAICVEPLSMQASSATSLAFAPDGRALASAHWDCTVRLWEVPGGRLLQTHSGLQARRCLVWSPDGCILACCDGKTICLWDVKQKRCRAMLHGHTGEVYQLDFTPDSSRLLSTSADSTLRIWDVQSGQCIHIIAGYAISHYGLAWSPDSTQLVSGCSAGLVAIWELNRGTQPRIVPCHYRVVYGVGWSPNGRWLASSGGGSTIHLWDPITLSCLQKFEDPSTVFLDVAWSPDGRFLACGTYLRGIQVWDVATHSLLWVGDPYLVMFRYVAWSPDGRWLAGSGDDGSVYLWEGMCGKGLVQDAVPTKLLGHHNDVISVAWSPDGRWLASGSGNSRDGSGELFMWDVQNIEFVAGQGQTLSGPCPVRTFAEHCGIISAIAWSLGGDQLITGSSDGVLRCWNILTGECVCTQTAHEGTVRSLKVSPDGKLLASCGDDGVIRIWDLGGQGQGPVPTALLLLQTLRGKRPYERLNITGITGITEIEKAMLQALGATDETEVSL